MQRPIKLILLFCLWIMAMAASAQGNGNTPPPPPPPPPPVEEEILEIRPGDAAEFPGGMQALSTYMEKNLRYPPASKAGNIQGKVYVEFIVSETGRVTNPKIKRGVAPELDAEALRLVREMPDWIPAKDANGHPMPQRYVMPVNFKL